MEIKKGIGVSPGVVISTAVVLDAEDVLVPKRQVDAGQVRILQDELASETAEGVGPALVVDDQLFQLGRGGPCVHHG